MAFLWGTSKTNLVFWRSDPPGALAIRAVLEELVAQGVLALAAGHLVGPLRLQHLQGGGWSGPGWVYENIKI